MFFPLAASDELTSSIRSEGVLESSPILALVAHQRQAVVGNFYLWCGTRCYPGNQFT